jgi:hypothetical protein
MRAKPRLRTRIRRSPPIEEFLGGGLQRDRQGCAEDRVAHKLQLSHWPHELRSAKLKAEDPAQLLWELHPAEEPPSFSLYKGTQKIRVLKNKCKSKEGLLKKSKYRVRQRYYKYLGGTEIYQQFFESLHQMKEWMSQVPWSHLYHQVKDGVGFAKDILEFIVIAKVKNKQSEQLPPQNLKPPSPYIPSSRSRKRNTKYRRRNFRKRK